MTYIYHCINSRSHNMRRLFFARIACCLLVCLPLGVFAHPSPNTLIFLDVSPKKVTMEVQLPVPELALSFKPDIVNHPEQLIEQYEAQLKEYLLAHIHAYATKDRPWQVTITNLIMDKGSYQDSNIPYWEVNATIALTPQSGDNTRNFYLDYDVIMHQVINHAALVSIRSDWENGNIATQQAEARAISWNLQDNIIPPLHVNLEKGSWWTGFTGMVTIGVRHIAEGTDHLMFLLVLLLPAPLTVKDGGWNGFGGTRYSLLRLLKVATAFTIGHSLTLLLGALGWVQLPQQPIEVLIAFSILVSAVHALRPLFPGKEIFVAGGFGLIHGLAFASTLSNLRLDSGQLVISILGFNIGIELMQLFIIAITVPWLIVLSRQTAYRYVRITGAVFAAMAAIAWMSQRTFQQSNLLSGIADQVTAQGKWILLAIALLAIGVTIGSKQVAGKRPSKKLQ